MAIKLVQLGAKVTIIDGFIPDHGGNIFNISPIKNKVSLHILNLKNQGGITPFLKDQDYVFNLAGSVSHLDSLKKPKADLENNVEVHISLLAALKKVNRKARVLYASTRQVYGNPLYLPVDEKHPIAPVDVNGINKYAAEQLHLLYHKLYLLPVTILRLTNTYGPHQLIRHSRQGFIGWFIHQAMTGGVINLFDGGVQVRDLNYVSDVVDAFLLAATHDKAAGEVFNLGSGEFVSLSYIAKKLISLTGRGSLHSVPFPKDEKFISIGDTYLDFSKIAKTLGWKPKTTLNRGLVLTVGFYKKYGEHYISL